MNIVGVSACSAGIAHTYIVQEKLEQAAKAMGHTCKIETQGSIGVENQLTPEEIAAADAVFAGGGHQGQRDGGGSRANPR